MSLILLNLNLKSTRKLVRTLIQIYGIGLTRAQNLCKGLGYDLNVRISEVREEDLKRINSLIAVKYQYRVDTELKKEKYDNIQIMKSIKCYRGIRHLYNLPVNGQRTHTNAKTRGWR